MSVTLTPQRGQPVIRIAATIGGNPFVSDLAVAETFVINRVAHHLSTANPDGTPHYEGTGTWSSSADGKVHKYACQLDDYPQLKYEVLVALRDRYLELDFTIQNLSNVAWDDRSLAIFCFPQKQNPSFADSIGTHTWAQHTAADGCRMVTIASLIPQPIAQWALYSHETVGVPAGLRTCGTLVARVSRDQRHVIGISFVQAPMLSGIMGFSHYCIHSNPAVGPLQPGEIKSNRGRICLDESSLTDFSINGPVI